MKIRNLTLNIRLWDGYIVGAEPIEREEYNKFNSSLLHRVTDVRGDSRRLRLGVENVHILSK